MLDALALTEAKKNVVDDNNNNNDDDVSVCSMGVDAVGFLLSEDSGAIHSLIFIEYDHNPRVLGGGSEGLKSSQKSLKNANRQPDCSPGVLGASSRVV